MPFIYIYIYFQVMCRKLCQNSVSGSGSLDLFDRNEPSVSVRTVIGIQPQVGDPPNHLVGGFKHLDYCPFHIWDVILPIDELIFFKMVIAPPTSHVWAQGLLTIYDWGGFVELPCEGWTTKGRVMGRVTELLVSHLGRCQHCTCFVKIFAQCVSLLSKMLLVCWFLCPSFSHDSCPDSCYSTHGFFWEATPRSI